MRRLLLSSILLTACWLDDGVGVTPSTTAATGSGGATATTAPDAGEATGLGTDDATTTKCLGCHGGVAGRWAQASSHSLLLDCNGCHDLGTTFPHAAPVTLPVCSACHSEAAHPMADAACTGCHDPHGTANAFLVLETVTLPDGTTASIHFTVAEGASPNGLVHTGAQAGSGLCEVCHVGTAHYDKTGNAAPHDTGWCAECHDHQKGFAPP